MGAGVSHIVFENVTKTFGRSGGEFVAIGGVSLEIAEKQFVAVVGPSGCGKTTLLRMAAGLETPSSGRVTVAGRPVAGPGPDRAVVFQQFALFPWKTVRENIAFGLKCRGESAAAREEAVQRYLALMGLEGTADSYPHQLSGGMQQRVAIARSYAIDPSVLLMDEPFGALDAQTRIMMQEELVRLARTNPRTVLFITHSDEEAVYLADRVVVMGRNPGRVVAVVDIDETRRRDGWAQRSIDDVTELPSFVHLRSGLWRMLREQLGGRSE
jgi:NitT/TauT family transport system ATP-binding protein